MNWTEIRVTTKEPCADGVAGLFHLLGAGGVVIDNPSVVRGYIEAGSWDGHGFSDEYLSRDTVIVKAYFPESDQIGELDMEKLRDAAGIGCEIESAMVSEEDWADSWKTYYHVTRVGERIVVKPSWEEHSPAENEIVIELDPGMAFGTGTHFTTRACLELLEDTVKGGEVVLDVGTGSGILAIAAAKLGAGIVSAIDNDGLAVDIARENVRMNGVEGRIGLDTAHFGDYGGPAADILIANITGDVIIALLPQIADHLKPGAVFIGAGINLTQWEILRPALIDSGFTVEKELYEEDWVAVKARR